MTSLDRVEQPTAGAAPRPARGRFCFTCGKRGITAAASESVRRCSAPQSSSAADEAVAGDVVVEADDVPRLLAAEDAALAPQRLEDVAVADVGVTTRMPRSSIRRWKPRFVIVVTATTSTPRSSARIATIWSPSTGSPALVDGEHPVAVAVERDAEVEAAAAHDVAAARRGRSRRSRR